MRQRLAWLVILALGAAACGSTAEVSRVAGPGGAGVGAADAGLQATGSVAQSGNGGAPGAGGSAITGGPTGLSAPVDSATLGPDSSATAAATGPVPVRPSAPILLGYSTAKDLSSTAGSVGITGGDPGDMTAQMNGIVSYVNRGG